MKKAISLSILFCLFIISCGDDDETTPENRPPSDFQVTTSVSDQSVTISWTTANDPDGDQVTYDVSLDGNNVLDKSNDNRLIINNLSYSTTYNGVVTAKDENGLFNEQEFNFSISEEPNTSPNKPILDAPTDSETGISTLPKFDWQEAVDPDGDEVIYDLYVDTVNPPVMSLVTDLST